MGLVFSRYGYIERLGIRISAELDLHTYRVSEFHHALICSSYFFRDFLPRGSGIVTRRPLVLQLVTSKAGNKCTCVLHRGAHHLAPAIFVPRAGCANRTIFAITVQWAEFSPECSLLHWSFNLFDCIRESHLHVVF
jgi:hypothetical protein